jgi:membrane-associated phospholipid phosphatase
MNLTDRIYLGIHLLLTVLVCVRHERVPHWPWYLGWNLIVIAAIVLLARKRADGWSWEFAHDWLPLVFFTVTFEEISFLSLTIRGAWQNGYIVAAENWIFGVSPIGWMHTRARDWLPEVLEFGYFAFYLFYPVVGGLFWRWRKRAEYRGAFRGLTDRLSIGYAVCYTTYLLFPTQSPANRAGVQQIGSAHAGIFQRLVRLIQNHAGVHGNAFPSSHIMMAFVVLVFVYRFLPQIAPWLLAVVLLMCVGAVFDGYHWASDVVVGGMIGVIAGTDWARVSQGQERIR